MADWPNSLAEARETIVALEAALAEARRERDRLAYELLARVGLPFVDPSAVAAGDEHLCDRARQIRDVVGAAVEETKAEDLWRNNKARLTGEAEAEMDAACSKRRSAVRALKQENAGG